jgi:hypothetical protein
VKRFSHRNHSFDIAKAGGMDNSVVSEEMWVIDKGKKKAHGPSTVLNEHPIPKSIYFGGAAFGVCFCK